MKTAAVFIHGMWSTSKRMEFWRTRLSQSMEAHAINLDRGNIYNPSDEKTLSDLVTQTERFLEWITADQLLLTGHSLGGMIVQKLKKDNRIKKRILAAPVLPKEIFGIDNFTQVFALLGELNQVVRSTVKPTAFWAKRLVFNAHEALGLKWDYKELVPQWRKVFEEVLLGISVPSLENTHIFVGSKDLITPERAQKKLAKYHNATFKSFPGHDHGSICQAEEVADYIVQLAHSE